MKVGYLKKIIQELDDEMDVVMRATDHQFDDVHVVSVEMATKQNEKFVECYDTIHWDCSVLVVE